MTTIDVESKECPICNSSVSVRVVGSTFTFGGPDLDTRPASMARQTIEFWIERCYNCGYVTRDLDIDISTNSRRLIKDYINTEEYLSAAGIEFKRGLSKLFYQSYLISRKINNHNEMLLSLLHASWACDDSKDKEHALLMRKMIVPVIDELMAKEYRPELDLIKADVMRRARLFGELVAAFEDKSFDEDIYDNIIKFQIDRARSEDATIYTMDDIKVPQNKKRVNGHLSYSAPISYWEIDGNPIRKEPIYLFITDRNTLEEKFSEEDKVFVIKERDLYKEREVNEGKIDWLVELYMSYDGPRVQIASDGSERDPIALAVYYGFLQYEIGQDQIREDIKESTIKPNIMVYEAICKRLKTKPITSELE